MSLDPILLMGGSGAIGHHTARALRAAHLGLDGQPPTPPGLYFPYQLLDAAAYLDRLKEEGGELRKLL
ncbi:hypothetical protein BSF43_45740 [Pseudomonas ogarae]|uniref:hypothetical protein n=1 Tax=Pseudomonas ogarae (strain DSM 112162 / CECT 30235 / F113) TaxID=1114970 RepID=UPI0011445D8A|nr:hypothetical protein [Pseudomonas ogarae]PBJ03505.1 hypothetical protein BSF43_45740 [Pseudomonas ogarae]